ncbi:tRNA uridine(34) hydroxylase [Buchnera aphidicola (Neophyllaphis podocarpi)]|uniref:oxygen-dependent tRNA uridine(34) hydroxylase TrhO n=1 Tax=Buchnera aphidicola TaxID=9 RepID=UPI0034644F7C
MSFLLSKDKKSLLNKKKNKIHKIKIVSFYKYFYISKPELFRDFIHINFNKMNILGRVYISFEGINAQISVPLVFYHKMKLFIYLLKSELNNLYMNLALSYSKIPFNKLYVRIKKQIVSDGIICNKFNNKNNGIYLNAIEVNNMIEDSSAVLVDMRNYYEYEIGHFVNSINVRAKTFKQQMQDILSLLIKFKNKKILMYCTGGIRCEKSTSLLLNNNFKNVYHIKGGILKYLRDVHKFNLPNYFQGKLFVFDARMIEDYSNNIISSCHQCNNLCDTYINCKNSSCHLLFIQCKYCRNSLDKYCSLACKYNFFNKTYNLL